MCVCHNTGCFRLTTFFSFSLQKSDISPGKDHDCGIILTDTKECKYEHVWVLGNGNVDWN
jgi:hypothetical protein